MFRIRVCAWLAGTLALGALAACAPTVTQAPQAGVSVPECVPAAPGDALLGNWLSVSSQKGVAGAVRTLFTLNPDGSMSYVQQVKRPNSPSQGLYESGCWSRKGDGIELLTLESNGSPVNLGDPIYTNTYQLRRTEADELHLLGPEGPIRAKRMSPGYRLPF